MMSQPRISTIHPDGDIDQDEGFLPFIREMEEVDGLINSEQNVRTVLSTIQNLLFRNNLRHCLKVSVRRGIYDRLIMCAFRTHFTREQYRSANLLKKKLHRIIHDNFVDLGDPPEQAPNLDPIDTLSSDGRYIICFPIMYPPLDNPDPSPSTS